MTGSERIEAAFSTAGARETPAVICYEGICIRDHWDEITDSPWWYRESLDVERQMDWRRAALDRTGQDWIALPVCPSAADRRAIRVEERVGEVWRADSRTGRAERLVRPEVGGWGVSCGVSSVHPGALADTREKVDAAFPLPEPFDERTFRESGRADLADALLAEYGREKWPICHVPSPLWLTYYHWGFEGMMTLVASDPDLVRYASERLLAQCLRDVYVAAALGARGIWIEECMTDMVSPEAFRTLNVPLVSRLVEEIRRLGMKSIYYYCGDPNDRWDALLAPGADALSLEESKKGWTIDIEEVVSRAAGGTVVLGNLDAIGLLPRADDSALAAEIERQLAAGRRNGGRFIMSIGSPVTPGTPLARVRRYCDLVHSLSGAGTGDGA